MIDYNKKLFTEIELIFLTVYGHLLAQNKSSMINEACAYRGKNGLMCAVGPFIPEDELDGSNNIMDFDNIRSLVYDSLRRDGFFIPHQKRKLFDRLFSRLQAIHDTFSPIIWEGHLNALAKQYDIALLEEK